MMTLITNHPSKYLVRTYFLRRVGQAKPPPSPEEIRRQLGWGLVLPEPVYRR